MFWSKAVWIAELESQLAECRAEGGREAVENAMGQFLELHDRRALARLTPEERAYQWQARSVLAYYIDAIWEEPKIRHANKGTDGHPINDPAYDAVAALRDPFFALLHECNAAREQAGDDEGDGDDYLDGKTGGILDHDRFERHNWRP